MAAPKIEAYQAYKSRPFTRADREHATLVYGGISWRAERVLQGALENLGYKAQPLPKITKDDLVAGRELIDIGHCCPTAFTAGNLANFLRSETARIGSREVGERYVYVTAGGCGPCRFGQYHQSYELALHNLGLDNVRLFLLAQDELDQGALAGDGLEINIPFTLGAVWAGLCTDVLEDLEYQVRPYEVVAGQTDAVVRESVEELYGTFRNKPQHGKKWGAFAWHLTTGYFTDALRRVRRKFDAIEVDRLRVKPIVEVTGEFYLEHVENEANHNIHRWLETEGAEVFPSALAIWLDYIMRCYAQTFGDRAKTDRRVPLKWATVRSLQGLYHWTYNRFRRALGDLPRRLPDQYEMARVAEPFYHGMLTCGEGDMLIGKAVLAHIHHKAHMVCELSPYGCLPNTMSVGAMANVLGRYPNLLYAPLEIKGDAEVQVLSRCQMILTEAKKRAQREYDDALARTGLSTERARAIMERHPAMRRATYPIPDAGFACTAANTVMHLAQIGARS